MKTITALLMALFMAISFVGCGSDDDAAAPAPLLPNATEASASVATGEAVAKSLVSTTDSPLNSVQADQSANVARESYTMISSVIDNLKGVNPSTSLNAVQSFNETIACADGGSYTLSGSIDDVTYAYNITSNYNNCNEFGSISNGSITISGSITDLNNFYGSISFKVNSNYSYVVGSSSMTMYAGTNFNMELTAANTIFTQTIKIDYNGELFGSENTRWVINNSNFSMYQTSGREYLDNLTSYIDYDTTWDMSLTPLTFIGSDVTGGETQYKFANGAVMHLTVQSTNVVLIEIYLNGDTSGVPDTSSTYTIL